MSKPWDNENRTRYYGKRVGDIVEYTCGWPVRKERATVVGYAVGDNNRIFLQQGKEKAWASTAERCTVVERVEDRKIKPHDEPHEVTEAYREIRKEQQAKNASNIAQRTFQINEIAPLLGLTVTAITEYQIRISNGMIWIDLWPTNAKFHNPSRNKRGKYDPKQLEAFLKKTFGL